MSTGFLIFLQLFLYLFYKRLTLYNFFSMIVLVNKMGLESF